MRHLLPLSFLLLTACGQNFLNKDPRTISGTNSVFYKYINYYVLVKGSNLHRDIPIQFKDLDGSTVGLCTRWSSGERQIVIDPSYWDNLDEGSRYQLIAHELGHCDLNRDHVEHKYPPTSIMDPYIFSLNSYNTSYYMNELFNFSLQNIVASMPLTSKTCVENIEVK